MTQIVSVRRAGLDDLDTVWTLLQTANLLIAITKDDQGWDDLFGGNPPFARGTAIGVYTGFAALGAAGIPVWWWLLFRSARIREWFVPEEAWPAIQSVMPADAVLAMLTGYLALELCRRRRPPVLAGIVFGAFVIRGMSGCHVDAKQRLLSCLKQAARACVSKTNDSAARR